MIVDVQRGGPSTGLPTKTEQADLLQAMFGRNGEAPVPVVAPQSPADCFDAAIEAVRIAITYRTPVLAALRRLPRQRLRAVADPGGRATCPTLDVEFATEPNAVDGQGQPGLPPVPARPGDPRPAVGGARHARPGAPHRRHREGRRHRRHLLRPGQPRPDGPAARRPRSTGSPTRSATWRSTTRAGDAEVLVLGWGSTYGPIAAAVRLRAQHRRLTVAQAHLRHLNPFPANPARCCGATGGCSCRR